MRRQLPVHWLVATLLVWISAWPAEAQFRPWPTERPPEPLKAPDVRFPPYEIRTLTNGLQMVVVVHNEQPVVNLRLLLRAGASQDPKGKPGVAAFTAQLLEQGTRSRSSQEISDTIDSIGGGLAVGASSDLSFVNILVMKDSLDLAFDLLSDIARNPAFAPQEIERQRQQILSAMQVSYEDPTFVANVVFDRLVYGFHPYGLPQNGTPESLVNLTQKDLQQFHQVYYVPNNAILAVVGDVTVDEAVRAAERALGDWPRKEIPAATPISPPDPTRRLIVVDKPGAVQTAIRVGHVSLPRAHADFLALDVAVKILGGEGGNRIGGVLRTERSLTYSASAEIVGRQLSGDLMAMTDTRSDATPEALRLMVEEIARLQRERVTERELEGAQAYLAGNFPLTIETPNDIAAQVLEAMLFGLDLRDLETHRERINAVTVNDIQRVARLNLAPDRLSIVLVGDASTFVSRLAGVGFDSYEVVSISELDLTTVDFRKGGRLAQQ